MLRPKRYCAIWGNAYKWARVKRQFLDTIRKTGLREKMGDNFYSRIGLALNFVCQALGDDDDKQNCPLRSPNKVDKD